MAYGISLTQQTTSFKCCEIETGKTWEITQPVLHDVYPTFDSEGMYLYFLSYREFNPVYDNLHFDLNFLRGMRPCLITLRRDLPSPFVPTPKPLVEPEKKAERTKTDNGKSDDHAEGATEPETDEERIAIDLEGIQNRVLAFTVPEGRYGQICGIKGKALFTTFLVEGSLEQSWTDSESKAKDTLEMYDFETQKKETIVSEVSNFKVGADYKTLIYKSAKRLRVMKASEKSDKKQAQEGPGRTSGWLDLDRIK